MALIGFSVWGVHVLEVPFILGLSAGVALILLYHRYYTGRWFNPKIVNGVSVTEEEWAAFKQLIDWQNKAGSRPADPPDNH